MGDRPKPGQIERETARMDDWRLAKRLEENAEAGRISRVLPETARQIAAALRFRSSYFGGKLGAYTVESWNPRGQGGGVKKFFGQLHQHDAAIGAFEEVVRHFPDEHITVRERGRPLRQHNEPPRPFREEETFRYVTSAERKRLRAEERKRKKAPPRPKPEAGPV